MENASKALLIAGGTLIALLIIATLVLTISKLGENKRSESLNGKDTQLADFNRDFDRYAENSITGTDIVSLIYKINDYNIKRENVENGEEPAGSTYVDYSKTITLHVEGLNDFSDKYAYAEMKGQDRFFTQDYFDYDGNKKSGNDVKKQLDDFKNAQNSASIETLKKLSSIYDYNLNRQDNINAIRNAANGNGKYLIDSSFKNYNGTNPSLDAIKKYRQYSEFKSSKFNAIEGSPTYYENGQIKSISLKFAE